MLLFSERNTEEVMLVTYKCLYKCLSNFKGNSDIERYQMASKKIPFKYARPVEEWLQEKGNINSARFSFITLFSSK